MVKKNKHALKAGERIRECRELQGMTQQSLSEACLSLLSPSRIANYEQGTREPNIASALLLGKALSVPAAYLMGLVDGIDRELLELKAETKRHILEAVNSIRNVS